MSWKKIAKEFGWWDATDEHAVVESMAEEIDRLRHAITCQNRLCPAHHGHQLVWCDFIVQKELRARREYSEKLREALEIAYDKVKSLPWKGGSAGPTWITEPERALAIPRPGETKIGTTSCSHGTSTDRGCIICDLDHFKENLKTHPLKNTENI